MASYRAVSYRAVKALRPQRLASRSFSRRLLPGMIHRCRSLASMARRCSSLRFTSCCPGRAGAEILAKRNSRPKRGRVFSSRSCVVTFGRGGGDRTLDYSTKPRIRLALQPPSRTTGTNSTKFASGRGIPLFCTSNVRTISPILLSQATLYQTCLSALPPAYFVASIGCDANHGR